jgi:hypothetical protein
MKPPKTDVKPGDVCSNTDGVRVFSSILDSSSHRCARSELILVLGKASSDYDVWWVLTKHGVRYSLGGDLVVENGR